MFDRIVGFTGAIVAMALFVSVDHILDLGFGNVANFFIFFAVISLMSISIWVSVCGFEHANRKSAKAKAAIANTSKELVNH